MLDRTSYLTSESSLSLGLEPNEDRTALQIIGIGRLFVGQGDGLQVFKIRA